MAVRGHSTSSDPARLALVYFDKNVANDAPVKFRYGTVKSSTNVTGGLSYNIEPDGSDAEPNNSGSAKGYEVVANNTSAKKGGPYAAVGLTSTNRAIVVWYDAAHSQLIYSYRDMGTGTYTEPTSADRFTSTWQDHAVVIDSGAPLYVDLVIDEQDGVHIGYYSGSRRTCFGHGCCHGCYGRSGRADAGSGTDRRADGYGHPRHGYEQSGDVDKQRPRHRYGRCLGNG